MAMTAATIHGCRACILFQADEALKLGASKDEILECIGVAVSLGGTMAEGQATRLIGYLVERAVIDKKREAYFLPVWSGCLQRALLPAAPG
jgi:AhpD family alkylhydroperoxidase